MNFKDVVRVVLVGGLLTTLCIPFIVANSQLFPFITGKAFTFRILIEILFGIWLVGMVWDRSLRPKFSWILGALGAFVAIILVADLAGVSFYKSFWSSYERMDGFITLLHVFAYFLVASSVLNTRMKWKVFFNISVVASMIMSLYVFMQLAGNITINQGGVRVDGTLGNATYLAVYMLFNIFITLFLLLRNYQEKNKISWPATLWYGAALICQTIVLYYTATRGAILGFIGGLIVFALIVAIFEKSRPVLRKSAIGILVGIVVLAGGFFAIRNTEFVKSSQTLNRFASLSLEEIKTQGRRYVWPMAIEGFKERPILGWGQENFNYVFNAHYDPRMYDQEPWFDRAHNIVLDWMIAGGLAGLLGYLSIFAALLVLIWKNQTFTVTDKALLIALAAAYFFQNLFVFDNLVSYMYFFALLAFVHSEHVQKKSESAVLGRVFDQGWMKVAAPVVAVALVVTLIYGWNTKQILANREIIKALDGNQSTTVEQRIEHFTKAFDYHTFADGEAAEQMFSQFEKISSLTEDVVIKQRFAEMTLERMQQHIDKYPNDARYLLFMGSFRNRIGDPVNALPYLERAREQSPNKQAIRFEIGFTQLTTGKYDESFQTFKQAYELEPEYVEAKILYAISALYAKNTKLANELLATIDESRLLSDERIIAAYHGTGNTAEAIKLLEKRIAANPTDPNIRFRIAAGYLVTGQRAKAVEILREAARLFPDAKQQAEYYIKEIQAGRNP